MRLKAEIKSQPSDLEIMSGGGGDSEVEEPLSEETEIARALLVGTNMDQQHCLNIDMSTSSLARNRCRNQLRY